MSRKRILLWAIVGLVVVVVVVALTHVFSPTVAKTVKAATHPITFDTGVPKSRPNQKVFCNTVHRYTSLQNMVDTMGVPSQSNVQFMEFRIAVETAPDSTSRLALEDLFAQVQAGTTNSAAAVSDIQTIERSQPCVRAS